MSLARELVNSASEPYRASGRFARGKLTRDPVFAAILSRGLLADRERILDLGCGQGLLAAWLLLLRVGDAGSGWGFKMAKWVDQMILLATGRGFRQLHCRSVPEWRDLLSVSGFDSEAVPMSVGTPFANVLMIATPR